MDLLLISNSTMAGEPYLNYIKQDIATFLGPSPVNALFIPYAGVTLSWDAYETKVKERFNEVGHDIVSIHHFSNPAKAIEEAQVIVVGGGNTWQLLKKVRENKLLIPIKKKVLSGTKYVGWSAGANLVCPTIKTTNDMPITDPLGFDAINLIPFQINPHYLDANPAGHGGETRQDRILEFLEVNRNVTVAGLREGCMFFIENNSITYKGKLPLRVFQYGKNPYEIAPSGDFTFLMNP